MENQTIETNVVKPKLSIFHDEVEYRLITTESENNLDSKISEIEKFMSSNHGFGESDEYKDDLYTKSKIMWNEYAGTLRDVEYTFYLNRKQYGFITSLLRDKLEYDVNTVFLAIELTNMLGEWVKSDKHKNDSDIKGFNVDATEITYIYHLIAKHKVKGLTDQTYLFAEVLKRIGDISKVISYYDTAAKNLSTDIQKWVAAFEPEEKSPVVDSEKGTIKAKLLKETV
jgi:hypothetical protein